MAASQSDFTNVSDQSQDLDDGWTLSARALQGLACLFNAKIATGTEPADVLHGLMLGISGQSTTAKDWRFLVDASGNLDFDENTGTDVSPTWVTRTTFPAGSAFTAPAHASSHNAAGSDPLSGVSRSQLASGTANRLVVNAPTTGVMTDAAAITAGRPLQSDSNGIPVAGAALTQNRLVIGDANSLPSSAAAITASRALVSDSNGVPTHATTTATEVGFLNGVTSAIQTQFTNLALFGLSCTSVSFTIADDAVKTISGFSGAGGLVLVVVQVTTADSGNMGIFYRASGQTPVTFAGAGNFAYIAASDTAPTGTGGTDNKINFQSDGTGANKRLFVNNRIGSSKDMRLFFFGFETGTTLTVS